MDRNQPVGDRHITRGFSLVELLVVLAIIALLIALLLPAIGKARGLSRLTICQTRMRSQVQSQYTFAADHKQRKAPAWAVDDTGAMVSLRWTTPNTKVAGYGIAQGNLVLSNYLDFEALLCPANAMELDNQIDRQKFFATDRAGSSYEYFWHDPNTLPLAPDTRDGPTIDQAVEDGHHALTMDFNAQAGHSYVGGFTAGAAFPSHPSVNLANVSFLDGSVEAFDSQYMVLQAPAQNPEKWLWWQRAHEQR